MTGTGHDPKNTTTIRTVSVADNLFPHIHPEGWRFVAIFAGVTLLLTLWWWQLFVPGLLLTAWCLYFFRDPQRVTPHQTGLLISPADGVVQAILKTPPPLELDMGSVPRLRISVFMNVFNCHVNRVPAEGTVLKAVYRPGRFVNASLNKASENNERYAVQLLLPDGRDLAFVQIAGLIARRIRCDLQEGMAVQVGERFGLIRFGSRVDVYLPENATPLVAVGQTAIAGETILADLNAACSSPPRQGVIR